jgi:hypothetical protein
MRAQDVVQHIVADLRGDTAAAHDPLTIVNYAAQAMESAKQGRYLRRFRKDLQFRAPIVGSAAIFTNSGNILTLTGAFSGYTLVPGDFVTLTLNGTPSGDYKVVSKTDSDSLVLDADGITTDYTATVSFDLNTSRVAVPADVPIRSRTLTSRSTTRKRSRQRRSVSATRLSGRPQRLRAHRRRCSRFGRNSSQPSSTRWR